MKIEELIPGMPITLQVEVNGEELTFESRIQEVYPKQHLAVADAVIRDNKIVSFHNKKLIVNVLFMGIDEKLQIFKNVTVHTLKKSTGSFCYSLSATTESMPHNRRESYRCFVGIPSSVQLGPNHAALPTIIRDISISGFAIVCDKEFEIEPDRVIHVLLKDYLEELSENFIYELYGHVARTQQLENGKFLYGCRLNNTSPQLDAYIMKKERLRLKKTHGGK